MNGVKKSNLPSKICQLVKDHSVGEKNGKTTGIMSNTVVKDVELVRCFFNLV